MQFEEKFYWKSTRWGNKMRYWLWCAKCQNILTSRAFPESASPEEVEAWKKEKVDLQVKKYKCVQDAPPPEEEDMGVVEPEYETL